MAAVNITVVDNEVTAEGTAGLGAQIAVPSNEVTTEGTAGLGAQIAVPSNEATLTGTAGFPVSITVPSNQVTLEGTGTPYPYLYIVDSANHRIQVTDYLGNPKFTIGSYGTGNGQFVLPHACAAYGNYLYVTDSGNARVQKFTMKGVYVTQWGSVGTAEGEFNNPMGIAVDRDFVWVIDNGNNRFQVFDKVGTFIVAVGELGSGENQFNGPTECSIDDVYFYINDAGNSRIVVYLKATEFPNVAELPVLELEATGYIKTIFADLELPVLELEATGSVYPVMSADIELPVLEMSAEGDVIPVMSADLELTVLELSSDGYIGIVGIADFELPVLELEATGYDSCTGTADFELPVLELEAYGEVAPVTVTYYAVSMNPVNQGIVDYTNYAFNSFAYFNGIYFGSNSNGIYELAGANDAGTDIDAIVLSGDVDTHKGSEYQPSAKRQTTEAWLAFEASGELEFILEGDVDGTIYYPAAERVKFGRGIKSRYMKFGIRNVDGAYFKLRNIRLKADPINSRSR